MELVLIGLTWKTCLVYLDDVMVMGRDFEEHLKNVQEVFNRFRAANLKSNPLAVAVGRTYVTGAQSDMVYTLCDNTNASVNLIFK